MSTIIVQELASVNQDVGINGLPTNSEIIVATALLMNASPLQRTKVLEVHLEYEATLPQTLLIEYSIDSGINWAAYSSIAITPTSGPQVIARRKVLTHHNLQLRLRSSILGGLRVLAFIPRVVSEAKVNP